MRHLHYVIHGYEQKAETGTLLDSCVIDVIATSEDGAIERARTLVAKSFYRVAQIVEHDPAIERADKL